MDGKIYTTFLTINNPIVVSTEDIEEAKIMYFQSEGKEDIPMVQLKQTHQYIEFVCSSEEEAIALRDFINKSKPVVNINDFRKGSSK